MKIESASTSESSTSARRKNIERGKSEDDDTTNITSDDEDDDFTNSFQSFSVIFDDRECWYCGGIGGRMILPCECRDVRSLAHPNCILSYIDDIQDGDLLKKLFCGFCKREISLVYPRQNFVNFILDHTNHYYGRFSVQFTRLLIGAGIHWNIAAYAALNLFQLYGLGNGLRIILHGQSWMVMVGFVAFDIAMTTWMEIQFQGFLHFLCYHPFWLLLPPLSIELTHQLPRPLLKYQPSPYLQLLFSGLAIYGFTNGYNKFRDYCFNRHHSKRVILNSTTDTSLPKSTKK